jgi:hypothetical protein
MFENIPREKVLEVVQAKGPLIPVKIVKELGGNTFVIGAVLSDLIATKQVRATQYLRVGSSPVYFVSGQEEKLQDFVNYLNEKDRRSLVVLKDAKVMRDVELDPLTRVCFQNMKDFAFPFMLDEGGKQETFWKFYLTSDAEAQTLARTQFHARVAVQPSPEQAGPSRQALSASQPAPTAPTQESSRIIEPRQFVPIKPDIASALIAPPATGIMQRGEPAVHRANELLDTKANESANGDSQLGEEDHKLHETRQKSVKEFIALRPKRGDAFDEQLKATEAQMAVQKEKKTELHAPSGSFAEKVVTFLQSKGIVIDEVILVKKGELSCLVSVPSPVGSMMQFCKAREKKNISDGDLATAVLEGQQKGLPILFLSTGIPSKKAQTLIETSKRNLSYVRIA